jgi:biotin operon repressor
MEGGKRLNHKQNLALENKRLVAKEVAKEVYYRKINKNEDTSSHEIRKLLKIERQSFRYYLLDSFFLDELRYHGIEVINGGNRGYTLRVVPKQFLKKTGIVSLSQEEST